MRCTALRNEADHKALRSHQAVVVRVDLELHLVVEGDDARVLQGEPHILAVIRHHMRLESPRGHDVLAELLGAVVSKSRTKATLAAIARDDARVAFRAGHLSEVPFSTFLAITAAMYQAHSRSCTTEGETSGMAKQCLTYAPAPCRGTCNSPRRIVCSCSPSATSARKDSLGLSDSCEGAEKVDQEGSPYRAPTPSFRRPLHSRSVFCRFRSFFLKAPFNSLVVREARNRKVDVSLFF